MKVHKAPLRFSQRVKKFLERTGKEEKPARDAIRVRRDARGYIELGEDGRVIDCHVQPNGKLAVIAVVAPLEMGHGVVLEIGLNRTTPYRVVERTQSGLLWSMNGRARVREISEHELRSAYPCIEELLEHLLIHQRSSWKRKEPSWGNGRSKPTYRGIGIRVDARDELLYRQMLLEDIRLRTTQIERLTRGVGYWLRRFKFSSGYSKKFLQKMPNAQKVANALSWQVDAPLHIAVAARKRLGAFSGGRTWNLCREILEAFQVKQIDDESCEHMHEFLYGKNVPKFPLLTSMRIRLEAQRHGKARHGQGCATLEVIPTEDIAERGIDADDDIPF